MKGYVKLLVPERLYFQALRCVGQLEQAADQSARARTALAEHELPQTTEQLRELVNENARLRADMGRMSGMLSAVNLTDEQVADMSTTAAELDTPEAEVLAGDRNPPKQRKKLTPAEAADRFIDDCVGSADSREYIEAGRLTAAAERWAADVGEKAPGAKTLARAMMGRGHRRRQPRLASGNQVTAYYGAKLTAYEDTPLPARTAGRNAGDPDKLAAVQLFIEQLTEPAPNERILFADIVEKYNAWRTEADAPEIGNRMLGSYLSAAGLTERDKEREGDLLHTFYRGLRWKRESDTEGDRRKP